MALVLVLVLVLALLAALLVLMLALALGLELELVQALAMVIVRVGAVSCAVPALVFGVRAALPPRACSIPHRLASAASPLSTSFSSKYEKAFLHTALAV